MGFLIVYFGHAIDDSSLRGLPWLLFYWLGSMILGSKSSAMCIHTMFLTLANIP